MVPGTLCLLITVSNVKMGENVRENSQAEHPKKKKKDESCVRVMLPAWLIYSGRAGCHTRACVHICIVKPIIATRCAYHPAGSSSPSFQPPAAHIIQNSCTTTNLNLKLLINQFSCLPLDQVSIIITNIQFSVSERVSGSQVFVTFTM